MNRLPALLATGDRPPPPIFSAETAGLLRHVRRLAADLSVLRLARQAVFLGAVLAAWITLKPFPSLSRLDLGDIVTGQEGLTYATFGGLAVLAFGLAVAEHRRALASLLSPGTIALGAWLCLGVVLSQDSGTSMKRLGLTAAVVLVTACLPLLAQSRTELRNLLALAALTLLGLCYVGLLVAPDLSIHQRNDLMEPELAGDWRGTFGHKNAAAAVMAMLLFVGVAVFRSGWRLAGALIVALAGLFLVGCEGKSALALSAVVFAISGLCAAVRSLPARAVFALGPVVLINVFTIGTVMSDALAKLIAALPIDATFTGRTDIWRFGIEAVAAKPVTGYGFAAYWGNQWVRDVAAETNSWAGQASHSHNGYLDTTLTLGFVGLALTLAFLVAGPLRDYHRARAEGTDAAPFATLFLQIWLFGLLLSAMESFFYDRSDPIWFTFLFAVFGLRYLARFRTR